MIKEAFLKTGVTKFYYTRNTKEKGLNILDIGLDNKSIDNAKLVYPSLGVYHGLDIADITDNDKEKIDCFYKINLDDSNLDQLENNFYDLIIMNHVLEHLDHGLEAVHKLSKKIKPEGEIFIEFPNVNSLQKKSFFSYNFHCDSTHKRIYQVSDVANILLKNDCEIISAGYSKPIWKYVYLIPKVFLNLIKGNTLGSSFAHVSNKISHVYARKKATSLVK